MHEVRADLVAIARARASGFLGGRFDVDNTILIGDTPRDVEAARDGGARAVAVAAGRYGVDELSAAGADVVVEAVTEVPRAVETLRARLRLG